MLSMIYIISRFKASLFWLLKDGTLYPHIKGKIGIQREIIKGCPKMWWLKEVDVDFFSSFDFRIRLTPQRETTLTKCWFVYPHAYSYEWLLPDVKTYQRVESCPLQNSEDNGTKQYHDFSCNKKQWTRVFK